MTALYTELLAGLGQHLGLTDGAQLADIQELVIDDFNVGFNHESSETPESVPGEVSFFTVLGRPDAARQADVHRMMLEGNKLWAGTGGATLGIQAEGGAAILAMRLPLESTTPEGLAESLDGFVEIATFWRAIINGEANAEASVADPVSEALD